MSERYALIYRCTKGPYKGSLSLWLAKFPEGEDPGWCCNPEYGPRWFLDKEFAETEAAEVWEYQDGEGNSCGPPEVVGERVFELLMDEFKKFYYKETK